MLDSNSLHTGAKNNISIIDLIILINEIAIFGYFLFELNQMALNAWKTGF